MQPDVDGLKQTDFDGSFTYSQIVAVNSSGKTVERLYPLPANDILHIMLEQKVDQLSVMDIQGTIVFSDENLNSGITKIDVSKFEAGLYFISISMEGTQQTFKFVVGK